MYVCGCVCIGSLQQRRHSQVKRWTKHVDLFSKDYIVIPINEEYALLSVSLL